MDCASGRESPFLLQDRLQLEEHAVETIHAVDGFTRKFVTR